MALATADEQNDPEEAGFVGMHRVRNWDVGGTQQMLPGRVRRAAQRRPRPGPAAVRDDTDTTVSQLAPFADIPPNPAGGRDLVVGDIHGHFDTVEHALDRLGYDPHRDRLFSLGDLVDHGPRSEDALAWIQSRFTRVVRGNHEQMLLERLQLEGRTPKCATLAAVWATSPGSGWWRDRDRSRDEREAWAEALARLPFAITLHTADGRVGLIHAQGPVPGRSVLERLDDQPLAPDTPALDWDTLGTMLSDTDLTARSERLGNAADALLWQRPQPGRSEEDHRKLPGNDGVALVLHGHHAEPTPRWSARRMLSIDTGVHLEDCGHLTIAEVQSATPRLHRIARVEPISTGSVRSEPEESS